jgi:hypothetical protein
MSLLIAALAELLPAHGLPLAGDPPRSMFRIEIQVLHGLSRDFITHR